MTKRALINIDYTNDFVTGALPVGEPAIAIEKAITTLTKDFIEQSDYVVFAIDLHKENEPFHPETKLFPPHNIEGTKGRELYGSLNTLFQLHKDKENVYWMDKTRYSAFAGTDLENRLRERGITEVHLSGLVSECCVFHTAIEAYNSGFKIVVHENAVASFDPMGHDFALKHFKNYLNAEIV